MLIVFSLNMVWMTIFFIAMMVRLQDPVNDLICREPFYLTEQVGGIVVSFYFLLMGITINKAVKKIVTS